jgi:hypothetical protein
MELKWDWLVVLPIILLTYDRINAPTDAVMHEREAGRREGWPLQYSDHELRRMGDRAPDFRYTT